MGDERVGAVTVVTGGNRGLGLETARQLARAGHRVLLTGRDEAGARAAADELVRAGADARWARLDVTDAASVAALADRLARDGATIDALVNNAAVSLDGFDERVARATLDANYVGPRRVTDALASRLEPDARVVMVSSGMGALSAYSPAIRQRFASPTLTRDGLDQLVDEFVRAVAAGTHARDGWPTSAYRVSKAALNALVRIVARERPAWRINAVDPGWVRTRMGGDGAPRSVEEGAKGIAWAATVARDGPTGGVFRDGRAIAW